MCCFPGGTVFCNKAVYERGDYKELGIISPAGNIKFYVKPEYIPEDAMERVKRTAADDRNKFLDKLKFLIEHDPLRTYDKMLDVLKIAEYITFTSENKGLDLKDKIEKLMPIYIERS